jgi:hypothetical protein
MFCFKIFFFVCFVLFLCGECLFLCVESFLSQNIFIIKLKNGKANPFSKTNPNILDGFLGANININTNIAKNYLD